eukprot:Rmarinus@m.29108
MAVPSTSPTLFRILSMIRALSMVTFLSSNLRRTSLTMMPFPIWTLACSMALVNVRLCPVGVRCLPAAASPKLFRRLACTSFPTMTVMVTTSEGLMRLCFAPGTRPPLATRTPARVTPAAPCLLRPTWATSRSALSAGATAAPTPPTLVCTLA